MNLIPIAHFHSPFSSKFGIPKQSGLVGQLEGTIVFEPAYRNVETLRGIDEFDFLWLIWGFSANKHSATGTTVRPPLLGGNRRMGVFATRSPFRPNPLGLSSVRIDHVEWETKDGPVIHVLGADLMDGTPIYDIKPYVAYTDCHEGVRSGFVDSNEIKMLDVVFEEGVADILTKEQKETLVRCLQLDPRPHYHDDVHRRYAMFFYDYNVAFRVDGRECHVEAIDPVSSK